MTIRVGNQVQSLERVLNSFLLLVYRLAEVTRSYSNFLVPKLLVEPHTEHRELTLADQSAGHPGLLPAVDAFRPPAGNRPLTPHDEAEVVRRFRAQQSLAGIARDTGRSWDSVARLLERAGVRPRR